MILKETMSGDWPGTLANMVTVLAQWQHNLEGIPATICQEDDGTLNHGQLTLACVSAASFDGISRGWSIYS